LLPRREVVLTGIMLANPATKQIAFKCYRDKNQHKTKRLKHAEKML
jgi:hypothetical protein